ncbi:MAG TPA: shikimate kinase [Acidobacteriaceae bacterium]|nr:shikimate kinase [Acidobacteriaceae bacterium]
MPSIAPKSPDSDDAHARARSIERIVLTGFMGSGKSTIGRTLAERLGWRFVDLDNLIEERDGRTVARIFAESGEPAFRAMETEALLSSLQESSIIVALGGGALETPANRHALSTASKACVVLLSAQFDTLYERCQQQIARAAASSLPVRPLLGDREAAAARLARREPIYREAAHVILNTTGQQPQQTVDALIAILANNL